MGPQAIMLCNQTFAPDNGDTNIKARGFKSGKHYLRVVRNNRLNNIPKCGPCDCRAADRPPPRWRWLWDHRRPPARLLCKDHRAWNPPGHCPGVQRRGCWHSGSGLQYPPRWPASQRESQGIDLDSNVPTENEYMKRYSAENYAYRLKNGMSR